MTELEIRALTAADAAEFSDMLLESSGAYSEYFRPFPFDRQSVFDMLQKAREDRFWGVYCGAELAGFFMLRGFDEGFARPAYGVLIRERRAGLGLASLALRFALSWCSLQGVSTVMLKVHPNNRVARGIYERAGFKAIGACEKSGQTMMEKILDSGAAK